jgi:hypothetical protein
MHGSEIDPPPTVYYQHAMRGWKCPHKADYDTESPQLLVAQQVFIGGRMVGTNEQHTILYGVQVSIFPTGSCWSNVGKYAV